MTFCNAMPIGWVAVAVKVTDELAQPELQASFLLDVKPLVVGWALGEVGSTSQYHSVLKSAALELKFEVLIVIWTIGLTAVALAETFSDEVTSRMNVVPMAAVAVTVTE